VDSPTIFHPLPYRVWILLHWDDFGGWTVTFQHVHSEASGSQCGDEHYSNLSSAEAQDAVAAGLEALIGPIPHHRPIAR
jgi:hypothetical protein